MDHSARRAVEILGRAGRILVFTGADISTESGIPDFRGPDGLWSRVDPDDFTIDRYLADPGVRLRTWQAYLEGGLGGIRIARPNAAHRAVVDLWRSDRWAGCITQNIDGLHQSAGLPDDQLAELHGNLRRVRCLECGASWDIEEVLGWVSAGLLDPHCPHCGGLIKTTSVLFGEFLPAVAVHRALQMADAADAVLAVGTTLSVYPAADLTVRVVRAGGPMVIVNLGPTDQDHLASAAVDAKAGEILPELIAAIA